ncbi:hypothetical protein HHUSO_G5683 [Huso huso]|uniref:BEN domain-containing protein n=1 Tax=Huso huso TaxID=61971 RepID=A0ABR1A1K2_HUSHU
MYLLVKWSSGSDKYKISIIPAVWVRNFDEDTFEENGDIDSRSYVAEWRSGKKTPRGGWPVYDCEVLKMSAKESDLKINEVDQTENKTAASKRLIMRNKRYMDDSSSDSEPIQQNKKMSAKQDRCDNILKKLKAAHEEVDSEADQLMALKNKVEKLEEENNSLKHKVVQAIPAILQKLEVLEQKTCERIIYSSDSDLQSRYGTPTRSTGNSTEALASSKSVLSAPVSPPPMKAAGKVEIHPGSKVFVEELAWALTNKATSCSSFVRSLTLAVFDVETLVRSNLRGGRNKRQQDGERKDALDSTKDHAIYAATLAKFPTATKSQIGSTINGKIAELRHNLRKQNSDKSPD